MATSLETEQEDQRWDLSSIFPSLESPAYEAYVGRFEKDLEDFARGLRPSVSAGGALALSESLLGLEALELRQEHLSNYMACLNAEEPGNAAVTRANLRLRQLFGRLQSIRAELLQKLDALDDEQFPHLTASPEFAGAEHRLALLRREAKTALPPREEKLISELDADGRQRWARLAAETLAQTTFDLETPGGRAEKIPFARRYDLMWDPRPELRRAAFDAINKAFLPLAPLMANCFNAMAGTGITLARRRGLDPIDEALIDNWIAPSTVRIMQKTLKAHAPLLQDYLRQKARYLGLGSLGVYDRSAPLDVPELTVGSVDEAVARIIAAFVRYCPELADHTRQVIAARWVETEMRAGKQPGGFCAPLPETRETRIFMSLGHSFNAVAVLAHELGHSFHAHKNFPLRFWQQNAPSSLSETASILCEHFFRRAAFSSRDAPDLIRLGAVSSELDCAVNYLLRIPRDFDFEVEFYRERAQGEVSADRLCQLMRNAHGDWFGTALSGDDGDGLSWAYNHIMMVPQYRVYNFPYSFGYLLSSRIADAFAEHGAAFTPTYVAFLRASASLPVEEAVSSTLGFDVTTEAFWENSLSGVRSNLDLFTRLAS